MKEVEEKSSEGKIMHLIYGASSSKKKKRQNNIFLRSPF